MAGADALPLQELLQALNDAPATQPQLRAVLAFIGARWELERNNDEQAVRYLAHALSMVPDLRPAMRLLYRLHLRRQDIRSAVLYLDQEIRATRHPREAAALYRERGQLVEAFFGDLGAALQCHQAALKATPRDLAVLRSVERASLARGDVFALIGNLEAQLDVLKDPGATAGVLRDLALLEARQGGDLALGSDLLLAALHHVPNHLGLISDLFRMAELLGDAELMLHALELEAEARPAGHRGMPLARASMTLREQRERSGAVTLLLAAAREQPRSYSLWRSLEELSMASNRYEAALSACVGQLRALDEGEDRWMRAELYYRIGRLALTRLDRVPEGLAAMRRALRLFPAHVPALEETARFLIANQMWAQLLELLKLELATAGETGLTASEIALAHLRAGQVLEENLGEPEGARRYYEDALLADPNFRPARDRLERVLHQLGRTDDLRRFYRHEFEHAEKASRRVFLLSVLSQLHAHDNDPSDAIKFLVGLLKEVPEHLASLQLLARLLARSQRAKELLRVTEQEIKLTSSAARRAKLLHRSGELAEQLGDDDKARAAFDAALEAVDDHPPSIEALERLLRRTNDDEALLELLRKKLLYATDRARVVALRLEMAGLLAGRMHMEEEALDEIEQLLRRWPRHLPALHAGERLAAAQERPHLLLGFIEQHIMAVSGPRTRALLLHRAARVRTQIGDHEGSIRDLVRALELWPQLGVARLRLLSLYEQLGRVRELQAFAEAGLTSERGADDRRAMALQLAELTPRPIVAIQYLGAVAEARPEDCVTQLRLARACRLAKRPAREAAALMAVASTVAREHADTDVLLALRYRAGRAEESAGNLDAAENIYTAVLASAPNFELARRGQARIKDKRREAVLARSARDFEDSAAKTTVAAHKSAQLTIAAELHERRRDLEHAQRLLDQALAVCPEYIPALHARARVLEQLGSPGHLETAIGVWRTLVERIHDPKHRCAALCRAGTLALRIGAPRAHNERAWRLFAQALALDPAFDAAFRGLQRTRDAHGTHGAPLLGKTLEARLQILRTENDLDASSLRELARLGNDVDGPECAAVLLEHGMDLAPEDPGVHADLAQAYAQLGRWAEVVRELETALDHELSPERRAALHYYAGEAHDRAGNLEPAIEHYLAAGRGGFFPKHSLLSADRIAARAGSLKQRVDALQLLVEIGDGPERVRSLRALADLHRGPLGQPEVAVELMRELLLLRPTDIDVLVELRRLLDKLGRREEAVAALLAGVAHHRAWLRSQAARNAPAPASVIEPILGLLRLFDATADVDGVYLATAILEQLAPDRVQPDRSCDALVSEPWPLPQPQEGRPFDLLVGDLPHSPALDLLREGIVFLKSLPGEHGPAVDLAPRHSLPQSSGVVMVTRALSAAMGLPLPLVFLDQKADQTVVAHIGAIPCIVVGRRINTAPFAPAARDAIGRALLRVATGGDQLHRHASPEQIAGLLVGLCRACGLELEFDIAYDEDFARESTRVLPQVSALDELQAAAVAFATAAPSFDPRALKEALAMAEDRAGAVCAADPRPALQTARTEEGIGARVLALVGYLLSEDHLSLRRTLGYQPEMELAVTDVEEVSG